MTLTKSRRSSPNNQRRFTPDAASLASGAEADRFTEEWIAKFDGKNASDADYVLLIQVALLRFQADLLLESAFERIAKLEAELRKTKTLVKNGGASFEIEQRDDLRTFTVKAGSSEHSFEIPVPIFRGAWKEGETYAYGDTAVWGGSSWAAMRKTTARPDAPESGWMIIARRGRDGKDAKAQL